MALENGLLTPQEHELWIELKVKTLGLAYLSRTIARQHSRIQYLAEGDAKTKFFQFQACHRTRKNYIHSLRQDEVTLIHEEDKRAAVDDYYDNVLSVQNPCSARLNFKYLGLPTRDLSSLDICLFEEEIWNTIRDMPSNKSPGPYGFTGLSTKQRDQ